ncbi:MAG: glycoside hydrolase family 3 C-terminal domain-containing protein, partial [Ruminococcus sp.]|nr:glycoside hydrolase family 3 C-terminal domain-containing protein [Ruminococcus sp.]
ERIAMHKRLHGPRGAYSTNPEHMPDSHRDYAEWNGDTEDMGLFGKLGLNGNSEARKEAEDLGKPTVTCIVAGRNVLINKRIYNDWDSVVMCYLPGSEGKGISDVLCGCSDFTGKLPSPWYSSLDQIRTDECWLERGYGLSYGDGFKPVDEPETILDPPTVVEPDPALKGTNYKAGLFKDGVYVNEYAGIKINVPGELNYFPNDTDPEEKEAYIAELTDEEEIRRERAQILETSFGNAKEAVMVFFVNTKIGFPDSADATAEDVMDYCKEWVDGQITNDGDNADWKERKKVKLGSEEFSRDVVYYWDGKAFDCFYMRKLDDDLVCWIYVTTSEQGRTPEYYESLFEDIK